MAADDDRYENWQATYQQNDWEAEFQAGRWNYLAEVSELPRYAMVAGYVHNLPGKCRMLDAGCGAGILASYLDLDRIEYFGFDLSRTAVADASSRAARGRVTQCAIDEFVPPAGVKYDTIVFNEVVQHTAAPLATLDRFREFLTCRGYIIVSLFKNPKRDANGPRLARFIETSCAEGRYALVHRAEAVSVSHNRAWQIFVLR